jgi:uncharacterized protein YmfQ (DUF2313 family)
MGWLAENYKKVLQALMPKGRFWNRDDDSVLASFFDALSQELARLDARVDDLLQERDTRYTNELLPDYETEYGLPDECSEESGTVEERRNLVRAKALAKGGLNAQAYIDIAEAYGLNASVQLYPDVGDNIFCWALVVTYIGGLELIYFLSGTGCSGDLLSYFPSINPVFCVAQKLKPAWTRLIEVVDGPAFGYGFSIAFDTLYPVQDEDDWLEGAFDWGFGSGFDVKYGGAFSKDAFDSNFDIPI